MALVKQPFAKISHISGTKVLLINLGYPTNNFIRTIFNTKDISQSKLLLSKIINNIYMVPIKNLIQSIKYKNIDIIVDN